MAKVKLSAYLADIRNAVGGSVFLKGRGGNVVRTAVTQTKVRSNSQNSYRQIFTVVSTAWRTLTVAQRNAWNAEAGNLPTVDVFGVVLPGTGFSYFMKVNLTTYGISVVIRTLPPGLTNLPFVNSVTFNLNRTGTSFTFSPVYFGTLTSFYVTLAASKPHSRGLANNSIAYRTLNLFVAAAGATEFYNAYINSFGVPAVGQTIYFRFTLRHAATGQQSAPQYYSAVVT